MDLQSHINTELWEALEKNYNNESYSSAILDSMHYLTETIRNKTGLEGDGSNLIGQAFGGDTPKIQLNKLQTESEKDIQKGMLEILKGLYTLIRNPRSHDKSIDTKNDADSIIVFINYLLNAINKSKLAFEENSFLKRVFDEHYVKSEEYSNLLVKEIPKRQRASVAIRIILDRESGDRTCLCYFMESLLTVLEPTDIKQIYKVVTDELMYADSHAQITTILKILPGQYWKNIDKAVRLRIENILLKDATLGRYDNEKGSCSYGKMATWISSEHFKEFENQDGWTEMMVHKLKSKDSEETEYVNKWLWDDIVALNYENVNFYLNLYITKGLNNNDNQVMQKVKSLIQFNKNHPWWQIYESELKKHPEIECMDLEDVEW